MSQQPMKQGVSKHLPVKARVMRRPVKWQVSMWWGPSLGGNSGRAFGWGIYKDRYEFLYNSSYFSSFFFFFDFLFRKNSLYARKDGLGIQFTMNISILLLLLGFPAVRCRWPGQSFCRLAVSIPVLNCLTTRDATRIYHVYQY